MHGVVPDEHDDDVANCAYLYEHCAPDDQDETYHTYDMQEELSDSAFRSFNRSLPLKS